MQMLKNKEEQKEMVQTQRAAMKMEKPFDCRLGPSCQQLQACYSTT